MDISPVFHTISPLRMHKAQQSLVKSAFPVHQSGASTILSATNIAPMPTSDQLMGYSVSKLQSVDRAMYQQVGATEPIGTIVNIVV